MKTLRPGLNCDTFNPAHIRNMIGSTGLYFFALGAWLSTALANLGFGLMVAAFIWQVWDSPALLRDSLLLLALAFTAYLILRTGWAIWEFPETRALQIKHARRLVQLPFWGTLVIAFWLSQRVQRIPQVLLLALAGFLIHIFLELDYGLLVSYFSGERAEVGMPINYFGFYCAAALLGVLLLAERSWGPPKHPTQYGLRITAWLITLVVLIQGVIFSQTRGVWLACMAVFPFPLALQLRTKWLTAGLKAKRRISWYALLSLVILLGLVLGSKQILSDRINRDRPTLNAIFAGNWHNLPFSSIKVRIEAGRYGLQKWGQRPFFGWGPGSSWKLLTSSQNESIRRGSVKGTVMEHFHNSHLELLVQIGTVGVLFFVGLYGMAIRKLWQAHRQKWIDADLFLFTLGAILFFLIACLFDHFAGNHHGRFFIALFSGMAYAFNFHPPVSDNTLR